MFFWIGTESIECVFYLLDCDALLNLWDGIRLFFNSGSHQTFRDWSRNERRLSEELNSINIFKPLSIWLFVVIKIFIEFHSSFSEWIVSFEVDAFLSIFIGGYPFGPMIDRFQSEDKICGRISFYLFFLFLIAFFVGGMIVEECFSFVKVIIL